MTPFEIESSLENISILVDTREQPTAKYYKRLKEIGLPYIRQKLNFGDYSAKCTLYDGSELDLSGSVVIERKMNLDEICGCYGKGRKRFIREFERAMVENAKVYLLIESGSWEKAYNGKYRSRMTAQSLTASLIAWLCRYNCQIIFCDASTTGQLIHDIFYREIKERLEAMKNGE